MAQGSEHASGKHRGSGKGVGRRVVVASDREPIASPAKFNHRREGRAEDAFHGGAVKPAAGSAVADNREVITNYACSPVMGGEAGQEAKAEPAAPSFSHLSVGYARQGNPRSGKDGACAISLKGTPQNGSSACDPEIPDEAGTTAEGNFERKGERPTQHVVNIRHRELGARRKVARGRQLSYVIATGGAT